MILQFCEVFIMRVTEFNSPVYFDRPLSLPAAPEAPPAEPEVEPETPEAPPKEKPGLDPFEPSWPPGRTEPQPKASE